MVTSVAPQLFFQCLHLCFVIFWLLDYFSSWEFRRLIPFCPCLILTHATSRPPVFWATHVNRKWSFLPHQIFIPLPDNVTALSYIIAWPRCWNGRSTSAGHCLVPRLLSFDENLRAKEGGKETTGETSGRSCFQDGGKSNGGRICSF